MSDEQVAGAGVDRIDIEVTTACNLGCAACPRTVAIGRGAPATVHMRLPRFRRILENLPHARVLQFDGAGEPTLHPDFPTFVAAARATGKFGLIGVTTNGLARDPSYFLGLAAAGLRRVTISVDTFDAATAARLRAGSDVDRLARAITDIARAVEITTAKLSISRLNIDGVAATLARLAQTGLRAIEVVPVKAHHPDHEEWSLDDAARMGLVARLAAFGPTLGKVGLFGAPALQPAGGRCALPERVLTVTVEGIAIPCGPNRDDATFGRFDLGERGFATLRSDPAVVAWLDSYRTTTPAACRGCGFNPALDPATAPAIDPAAETTMTRSSKPARRGGEPSMPMGKSIADAAPGEAPPTPIAEAVATEGGARPDVAGPVAAVAITPSAPASTAAAMDAEAYNPAAPSLPDRGTAEAIAPQAEPAKSEPAAGPAEAAHATPTIAAPQPVARTAASAPMGAGPSAAMPAPVAPPAAALTPKAAIDRAIGLQVAGDFAAAETLLRALAGHGETAEVLHRLGLGALQRGAVAEGVRMLEAARTLSPDTRIAFNTTVALARAGRHEDAIGLAREALSRTPDHLGLHQMLAGELLATGDRQGAVDVFGVLAERALKVADGARIAQAIEAIEAIGLEPKTAIVLANLLRIAGRQDEALRLLALRLAHRPADIPALLTKAMAGLAIVHASEDEIDERRRRYQDAIAAVADAVTAAPEAELAAAASIVGVAKPFFLAYQGYEDRALQAVYGGVIARLIEASGVNKGWTRPAAPEPGEKIRIGFATLYAYTHSVLKLFLGWLETIDRSRFEISLFHFGTAQDGLTERAIAAVDHYHSAQKSAAEWVATIRDAAPHVMVYLELGMDQTAIQVAATRLAPVQCMTWGHPETSGLPDMDYFLSSDLMEPADGETHYTERLIRLPNLSVAYSPLPSEGGRLTRADIGLRADATVYVCCQSLFKYLPRYDAVFVEIARRVPDATFLFIGDPASPVTVAFRTRLAKVFADADLDFGRHVVICRPVPFELFPSFLKCGDAYLDSIGWSGGNTTLEAVTCDLPFVTLPVGPMRGRHSYAIAKMMGIDAFVADSTADYVARAVDLADPTHRVLAIAKVKSEKHRLFGDTVPTRALEAFFERAVTEAYGSDAAAEQTAAPATAEIEALPPAMPPVETLAAEPEDLLRAAG